VVLVAWAKCRAAVNIIQILGDVDSRTRSGSYTYLLVCLHCILASLNRLHSTHTQGRANDTRWVGCQDQVNQGSRIEVQYDGKGHEYD